MYFSVIIPVYNCENTLADSVHAVACSGLEDYEILLIDDGSTDRTGAICDELAAASSEVRRIHQKNGGVSSARNRGIAEARGKYLLFVDSDDSFDRGLLLEAEQIVRRTQPDMLMFGVSFDYYHKGRLYRSEQIVYPEKGLLHRAQWSQKFQELYQTNMLSPVWNKFIRRELVIQNDIQFNKDVIEMEDFLFSVNCLEKCDSVFMLPQAIYRYRQPENERGTYRRLCRVGGLTEYMQPFEQAIAALEASLTGSGEALVGGRAVLDQIYGTMLQEMLRFGTKEQIASAGEDMLNGRYAEAVRQGSPSLYQKLEQHQIALISRQRRFARVRHRVAVHVKSTRSRHTGIRPESLSTRLFRTQYHFTIALQKRSPESILSRKRFQPAYVMPANPDYWYADPILAEEHGRTWLFYEAVENGHGHIEVAEVLEDCSLAEPTVLLKDETHYSYPFVFQREGMWYMIPESSAANEVRLYRAVSFPVSWELQTVLLHARAVDTTVFCREGQWRMLTFLTDGTSEKVTPKAYAMNFEGAAVSLQELPWPCYDALQVRGAGGIFEADGAQYRPTQVSRLQRYGDAVLFHKIITTDDAYREMPVTALKPEEISVQKKYVDGLHTYSVSGQYEAIDLRCREFDLLKLPRRLLSRLRK